MATRTEGNLKLSRAVSEADLNTALANVQTLRKTGLHYDAEALLSLRPHLQKHEEQVGVVEIEDGVKTPPERLYPNAPPPTPETPALTVNPTAEENTSNLLAPPNEEKKKRKKSSGRNKKPPVTGFEEFYTDPPVTPVEYEEELGLYDESNPFEERIQTAIQRYRARRKLDEVKSNVLTKYLMLGGVDASNKVFTGGELDKETLETATAAEIAALKAQDYIRTDIKNAKFYDGSADWVVDFAGVAKGFFSSRAPYIFPMTSEQDIRSYAAIIRNFLNYILHHEVCKEYTKDIMEARDVCDQAEQELWSLKQASPLLPGEFNIAASSLYGGHYFKLHSASTNSGWGPSNPEVDMRPRFNGYEDEEAQWIFKAAMAFAGDDGLCSKVESTKIIKVINSDKTPKPYEIAEIQFPDDTTLRQYATLADHKGKLGKLKPVGIVKFKPWSGPAVQSEDLTDDENEDVMEQELQTCWLEHDTLKLLNVGMKMEIRIHTLNIGVKFFDLVEGTYCSFYTKLENEKMIHWKEPIPNIRPAPTEDDPDSDERAMAAEIDHEG